MAPIPYGSLSPKYHLCELLECGHYLKCITVFVFAFKAIETSEVPTFNVKGRFVLFCIEPITNIRVPIQSYVTPVVPYNLLQIN